MSTIAAYLNRLNTQNLFSRLTERAKQEGIIEPDGNAKPDFTKTVYKYESDGRKFNIRLGIEEPVSKDGDTEPSNELIGEAKLTQHPIFWMEEAKANYSFCTFHITDKDEIFFSYSGTWPDQGEKNMLLWLEGKLRKDDFTLFKHGFGPEWIDVSGDAKLAPYKDDFEARVGIFIKALCYAVEAEAKQ